MYFNIKFSRLGKGEGLDHMTIIGHMIITWSSWSIHELFKNCSWINVHELFQNCSCTIFKNCSWTNHELVVHELFMNYSSWTKTYALQVHEPHQLHELGHFMFMDSSWTVHE